MRVKSLLGLGTLFDIRLWNVLKAQKSTLEFGEVESDFRLGFWAYGPDGSSDDDQVKEDALMCRKLIPALDFL